MDNITFTVYMIALLLIAFAVLFAAIGSFIQQPEDAFFRVISMLCAMTALGLSYLIPYLGG